MKSRFTWSALELPWAPNSVAGAEPASEGQAARAPEGHGRAVRLHL